MTAQEQAAEAVRKVNDAMETALSKWLGAGQTLASWFGVSPQDQVIHALNSIDKNLDGWRVAYLTISETDQAGWSKWIADGNQYLKLVADAAQDANASSLGAIIVDTIAATAAEVKEDAQKVAAQLPSIGLYLGVGLVVVVGTVAYFRHAMRGV